MIHYKTKEEIELIRESSLLVAKTLAEVAGHIRPGITTRSWIKLPKSISAIMEPFLALKAITDFPLPCVSHPMRW
jgi:methionyl aminopeptidase